MMESSTPTQPRPRRRISLDTASASEQRSGGSSSTISTRVKSAFSKRRGGSNGDDDVDAPLSPSVGAQQDPKRRAPARRNRDAARPRLTRSMLPQRSTAADSAGADDYEERIKKKLEKMKRSSACVPHAIDAMDEKGGRTAAGAETRRSSDGDVAASDRSEWPSTLTSTRVVQSTRTRVAQSTRRQAKDYARHSTRSTNFDERLRRKLEEEEKGKGRTKMYPSGDKSRKEAAAEVDDYERRIREKLKQEERGVSTIPDGTGREKLNQEKRGKSMTNDDTRSSQPKRVPARNRAAGRLASSMPPQMHTAGDDYEEKIKKKLLENNNNMKQSASMPHAIDGIGEAGTTKMANQDARRSVTGDVAKPSRVGSTGDVAKPMRANGRTKDYIRQSIQDTSFDDRLRRKLEGEQQKDGQARKYSGSKTKKEAAAEIDDYEQRVREKLKQEEHSVSAMPDGATPPARQSKRATARDREARRLACSMPPQHLGHEQNIRGKLKQEKHSKSMTSEATTTTHTAIDNTAPPDVRRSLSIPQVSSFRTRLKEKMESSERKRDKASSRKAKKKKKKHREKKKANDSESENDAAPKAIPKEKVKEHFDESWSNLNGALQLAATRSVDEAEYKFEDGIVGVARQYQPTSQSKKNRTQRDTTTKDLSESNDDEKFHKRMIRRNQLVKGHGIMMSQKMISQTILETDEIGDVMEDSMRSNASSIGLVDDMMHSMRSLSCSNLCPGSWECRKCTYINEPVGLETCDFCNICQEPKPLDESPSSSNKELERGKPKKQQSFKLQASFRKSKSKDNLYISWSELGCALDEAKEQNLIMGNDRIEKDDIASKSTTNKEDLYTSWSELGGAVALATKRSTV